MESEKVWHENQIKFWRAATLVGMKGKLTKEELDLALLDSVVGGGITKEKMEKMIERAKALFV